MSTQTSPKKAAGDESLKDTFESIIIAFILAFVFRAYVVEAFVIPTGSMAPTLLGEHVEITCGQCGYHFKADAASSEDWATRPGPRGPEVVCPMCHHGNRLSAESIRSAGDRILVHKYLYSVVEPRRWDVVVFKNPQDPNINFIKRLIGLPGESITILDGNIYVRPEGAQSDAFEIARKTDHPKVQEAVWQPIYHSDHVPLDGGVSGADRDDHPWRVPWRVESGDESKWRLESSRSYRHDSADTGSIRFEFTDFIENGPGVNAYNQLKLGRPVIDPIEDVRVAASFQPDNSGLSTYLTTSSRLNDTAEGGAIHVLRLDVSSSGEVALSRRRGTRGESETLGKAAVDRFEPGVTRRVELWYVDQEASAWVDGKRVLQVRFDIGSLELARSRRAAPLFPEVTIGVTGSPVTMHRVDVDRDIYYTAGRYSSLGPRAGEPWAGVILRTGGGTLGTPLHLENDQFFCLGDNSPLSLDGRAWNSVNPWIRERMLADNAQQIGVVPRKLMMGRAFFVYYPAPYAWRPGTGAIFPNFGDMRFIY